MECPSCPMVSASRGMLEGWPKPEEMLCTVARALVQKYPTSPFQPQNFDDDISGTACPIGLKLRRSTFCDKGYKSSAALFSSKPRSSVRFAGHFFRPELPLTSVGFFLWLGSFCGGFPPDFSVLFGSRCDGGAPPCTGSSSRSKESERIVIRAPHARRRAASQHALRRPHATCAALRAGRTTASAGAGGTREGPSRERAGPEGPLVGRRVSPHSLRPAREASRATHTTAGGAHFSHK